MLCIWQKMIEEMTHRLVKLIRGALLPTTLPQVEQFAYGGWDDKTELTGAWLTQIIHTIRFSDCPLSYVLFLHCSLHVLWTSCLLYLFMNLSATLYAACLTQGLLWGSDCSGDPKWFAAGDSGSAAGVKSSLPCADSGAHYRRWGRTWAKRAWRQF